MAGPSRPTPPSAIDGFRRLERTRTVSTPTEAIAATATVAERSDAPRRRRRTARRMAGAARLLVLVVVLATIIGSSYSLASSGGADRAPAERAPAADTVEARAGDEPESVDTAADDVVVADADSTESMAAGSDDEPTSAASATAGEVEPAVDVAVAASAPATTPTGSLPFTDNVDMQPLLLAGSLLVLLGMLVQVAGQPLPARARR